MCHTKIGPVVANLPRRSQLDASTCPRVDASNARPRLKKSFLEFLFSYGTVGYGTIAVVVIRSFVRSFVRWPPLKAGGLGGGSSPAKVEPQLTLNGKAAFLFLEIGF